MHFIVYFTIILPFVLAGVPHDEDSVQFYQLELDELNKLVDEITNRLEFTEQSNVEYARRLTTAEETLGELTESSEVTRREFTESQVAFYVKLSGSLHGLSSHDVVKFDEIVTNTSGSLYDTATGIFTAPVTGMYVLSWTANVYHTYMQSTELMVDGKVKAAAFADTAGHGDGDYGSASQTVVLEVRRGNKVWVRTGTEGKGSIHGADYSTFSGFLLFPMN